MKRVVLIALLLTACGEEAEQVCSEYYKVVGKNPDGTGIVDPNQTEVVCYDKTKTGSGQNPGGLGGGSTGNTGGQGGIGGGSTGDKAAPPP